MDAFAERISGEIERLIRMEGGARPGIGQVGVAVFRVGRDLRYQWAYDPRFDDQAMRDGVLGKSNRDLFVAEDADRIDAVFADCFSSGQSRTVDATLRCLTSGEGHQLRVFIEPVVGADRTVEALAGASLEFSTAGQRSEPLLTGSVVDDARRRAECANVTKTRFLAATGHDLRQPLQAMRFFQSAVANRFRSAGDDIGLKAAEVIGQAITSAEELLNSLMDLATLESGQLVVRVVDFPADQVVDGNISEFAGMAERKGLRLRVRPSAEMIRSDPVLLKRILRNLSFNAIKYTDRGGVLVGCQRRGEALRIGIWDTGSGIAADKVGRIFDEFYRGDPVGDPGGGFGIGLAVVARLAYQLGHQITVRSRLGKGSLFAVTVPLAE